MNVTVYAAHFIGNNLGGADFGKLKRKDKYTGHESLSTGVVARESQTKARQRNQEKKTLEAKLEEESTDKEYDERSDVKETIPVASSSVKATPSKYSGVVAGQSRENRKPSGRTRLRVMRPLKQEASTFPAPLRSILKNPGSLPLVTNQLSGNPASSFVPGSAQHGVQSSRNFDALSFISAVRSTYRARLRETASAPSTGTDEYYLPPAIRELPKTFHPFFRYFNRSS